MKALTVTRVELGYCANCNGAAVVGHISMRGWAHEPAVCRDCLAAMITRIDRVAAANGLEKVVEVAS